jgi:hypothetical protein
METTRIAPERTVGEVTSELVRAGASQISTDYKDGKLVGLRWIMRINGVDALFDMPARVEPVMKLFLDRRSDKGRWINANEKAELRLKAERVAWRQLLRWCQAQNAMIESQMVQPSEVFLAYLVNPSTNQTLFQHMMETRFKALPPASEQ